MTFPATEDLHRLIFLHGLKHYVLFGALCSLGIRLFLSVGSGLIHVRRRITKHLAIRRPTPLKNAWKERWARILVIAKDLYGRPVHYPIKCSVHFIDRFLTEMIGQGEAVTDFGLSFIMGWLEFLIYPILIVMGGWTFLGGWIAAKITVLYKLEHPELTQYEINKITTDQDLSNFRLERHKAEINFRNTFTSYMIASGLVLIIAFWRASKEIDVRHKTDHTEFVLLGNTGAVRSSGAVQLGSFPEADSLLRSSTVLDSISHLVDDFIHQTKDVSAVFIIGHADKRDLKGPAERAYGDNTNLAEARARFIKQLLIIRAGTTKDQWAPKFILLPGGAMHVGLNVPDAELERDRSVTLVPIYERDE